MHKRPLQNMFAPENEELEKSPEEESQDLVVCDTKEIVDSAVVETLSSVKKMAKRNLMLSKEYFRHDQVTR